jgi:hypothetical protein
MSIEQIQQHSFLSRQKLSQLIEAMSSGLIQVFSFSLVLLFITAESSSVFRQNLSIKIENPLIGRANNGFSHFLFCAAQSFSD